jgi:hypothetical protein
MRMAAATTITCRVAKADNELLLLGETPVI